MTSRFDRISVVPNICHGRACVKGTRIPVHQIVGMLANGDSFDILSRLRAIATLIMRRLIGASQRMNHKKVSYRRGN